MDSRRRVMEAVEHARAASKPSAKEWHVCVREPDGGDLISFTLGSYADVEKLAREIGALGYEITLLHPTLKQCDFVLEPRPSRD